LQKVTLRLDLGVEDDNGVEGVGVEGVVGDDVGDGGVILSFKQGTT